MDAQNKKNGKFSRGCTYLLLLLVMLSMVTFSGCDPMESDLMKNENFTSLLEHFGYKPLPEPTEPTEQSPWLMPCQYNSITSPYGERIHPITGKQDFHEGIDLAAPEGTPIYASRAGTVVYAGWDNSSKLGGGNYVSIDHGDGYKSQYMHMKEFIVEEGQQVVQGQIIGYVGDTGGVTGFHLHFVIRQWEESTQAWISHDPTEYMNFPNP